MKKKLRFLMVAAFATMFSTAAMAQDDQAAAEEAPAQRVSANGSYQFKPSWGIGLQYGMTFWKPLDNFNDYYLIPGGYNYYDVKWLAEHELYVEFTPVSGFRLSVFGGWQSPYLFGKNDATWNYAYGGIEPAFSIRRSFFEFAIGAGVAYGYNWGKTKVGKEGAKFDWNGHGLLARPFVEFRFYAGDVFAIYLRAAFEYFKDFSIKEMKKNDVKAEGFKKDKLFYAQPNAAVGVRFGSYPTPKIVVGDTDGDGVLDDIDDCPEVAGSEEFFGCANPDPDSDKVCDAWVSEQNLTSFDAICKGKDLCPDVAGSIENNGCPNPDVDGDGLCDPWVSQKGMLDRYANVCKGEDKCPTDAEDLDGFQDDDGCPDADNDSDKICDPWVEKSGAASKYENLCKAADACPDIAGYAQYNGCPAPDTDGDGYCDEWVYNNKLEKKFNCKGVDKCPTEKGTDENGCIPRRVVVTADKIEIKDKIFFATNKSTIKKESDSLLEEIAKVFKENPQIKKIEIQGHTDSSGKAAKNLKLSEGRAKAVHDRLIKLGVEKDRLTYKGYGSTKMLIPLEPGQKKETKEQAEANRRVEFVILEQATVTKEIDNPALKKK